MDTKLNDQHHLKGKGYHPGNPFSRKHFVEDQNQKNDIASKTSVERRNLRIENIMNGNHTGYQFVRDSLNSTNGNNSNGLSAFDKAKNESLNKKNGTWNHTIKTECKFPSHNTIHTNGTNKTLQKQTVGKFFR